MVSRPIILRSGEVEDPLSLALDFAERYVRLEAHDVRRPMSFDAADVRSANRGGARISSVETAAILERRREIERGLRAIPVDASLAAPAPSIPWIALTRLFDSFAGIRGVGFSKMTKALHPKRPALIPMLDSVVQAYLADEAAAGALLSFGERALALVCSYKRDVDRNRVALRGIQRALERRSYRLTEVRILDVLIWSVSASKNI
jgi:hypothetical protein